MVGAQECIGNWGEAKLVSALSALGQAKVDLSFQLWVILANEVDPSGQQNWAVDNMLGRRLTGGNPIVNKEIPMCV